MKRNHTAFLKLIISMLFMLTVLEPVKALETGFGSDQVRLHLAVDDFTAFASCDINDPILSQDEVLGTVSLLVNESLIEQKISTYRACDGVLAVYQDHFAALDLIPTDPNYATYQFNLKKIGLEEAWNITKGSTSIIVAVVDSGVDPETTITDFSTGTILKGVSILTNETTFIQSIKADTYVGQYSYDGGSHGTAVASVIAAGMNSKTITGVAPNVRILPIKVFRDEKTLNEEVPAFTVDVSKGIVWAVDHGADIINLSLGTYDWDYSLAQAIQYAESNNVLVVAASGNNADHNGLYGSPNNGYISYPAVWDEVISVGSITKDDKVSNFSSTGNDGLELVAYGDGIWLPWSSENKYKAVSGTSFSAPTVSGVLALILSAYPNLTPLQARGALISGVTDINNSSDTSLGYDSHTGYGVVNAAKALEFASKVATLSDHDDVYENSTIVELLDEVQGNLQVVGDRDMYCIETVLAASLRFQVDVDQSYNISTNLSRRNPDGSMYLYSDNATPFVEIGGANPGIYCAMVYDLNGRTTSTGRPYKVRFTASPIFTIPSILANTSAGELFNNEISFYPVQITIRNSYKAVTSVTKDGVGIAMPENKIFNDEGKYVVTVDDTKNDPVTFSFEIKTGLILNGFINGRLYNKPITVTYTADSATLDGQPFASGSTVSTDGTHELTFKIGERTYQANFRIDRTPPIITGMSSYYVLYESQPITYNEGIGLMDGVFFASGGTVTTQGYHSLKVTDEAGNSTSQTILVIDELNTPSVISKPKFDSIDLQVDNHTSWTQFYRIYQVDPVTHEKQFIVDSTNAYYEIKDLTDFNALLTYEVSGCRTVDTVTLCSESTLITTKTMLEAVYAAPSRISHKSFLFSWVGNNNATGYDIFVNGIYFDSTTEFTYLLELSDPESENTSWKVDILATRMDDGEKILGSINPANTQTLWVSVPRVTNITAQMLETGEYKIDWDPVPYATSYRITFKITESGYSGYSGDYVTNEPTITVSGLMGMTSYNIYVYARTILINGNQISSESMIKGIRTNPSKPLLSGSSTGADSVTLTWPRATSDLGYYIYEYNKNTKAYDLILDTAQNTATFTGKTVGEISTYKVKAYSEYNTVRFISAFSNEVALSPMPVSVNGFSVTTIGADRISLNWTAQSGITGYEIFKSTTLTGTYTLALDINSGHTATITGLAFNANTYFKIRPYLQTSSTRIYGPLTSAITAKTALENIANFKASSSAYNSNLITWSPVSLASGYELWTSTGTSTTYVLLKTQTTTSFTHTTLITNTRYNYKVRAYRLVGTIKVYGAYTSVLSSVPLPSAPQATVASAGYNALKVSWPVVVGANGYEVSYASIENGTYTKLALLTTNSVTISNLLTNTSYFVKVRAYRTINTVKIYGDVSLVVSGKPIPSTPVLSSVSLDYDSVKLSWTAVLGATGYELYRRNTVSGNYELILDTTLLTFNDDGLVTGADSLYKVKAYRLVGEARIYGIESSVTTIKALPSLVIGLKTLNPKYTELSLSWNAVAGATGYEISRSTSSTGTYVSLGTVEGKLSFINTGLSFNATYYYKVRPYTTVNSVKVYGSWSAYVLGKTALETVVGQTAVYTSYNSNKISWSAVNGASGYQVYRSIKTSTTYSLIATVTSTSYTNTSLYTNTRYNYKIRAYRLIGTTKIYGLYSAIVSATPLPWNPTITVASSGYNSLKVSWPVVAGANGYEVSYATTETGTYTKIPLVTTNSATIPNLLTNTSYYVKVRAYRTVSYVKIYGAYSLVVSGKAIPSTPVMTLISNGYDSVKITWPAVLGATGYELYRINPSTRSFELCTDTALLTYTQTGLVSGQISEYMIKAYRLIGSTKVYSVDSSVKSVTPIPSLVSGFKLAMPSVTSLKLAWTPVLGATGYEITKATSSTGTYSLMKTVEGSSEFTVTGLTFNTTTYYKIRAYTTVNTTKVYGPTSSAISAKTIPSTVVLSVVNTSYLSHTLSWPAIEGASGYEIYRSTGTSTYYTLLKTQSTTSFLNTALAFNTQYNYKVRAYKLVGTTKIYGSYSSIVSKKTLVSDPSAIFSMTHDSITVSWAAVIGASGYEISIATSLNGTYTISTQTTLSKTYTGLSTGTAYFIKLRAYRLVSTTKVYNLTPVIITITPSLSVPVIQLSGLSATSATLSWLSVSGATDYEVRIKSDAPDSEWIVESVSALSATFDDLDMNAHYTAEVRAIKKVNEVSIPSAYSEPITFSYSETS